MSLEEPLLPKKPTGQLLQHLADPEFRRAWTAFLQQTYCYENMQFYQAVEEYQARPTDERVLLARHIYANYIEDGAEYQVNLSSQERRPLITAIACLAEVTNEHEQAELATRDLFDKAQKCILLLMQTDSLTAFLRSPLYRRLVKDKEADSKQRLLQEEKEKMADWMRDIIEPDHQPSGACDCSFLFRWCCCCYWCSAYHHN